MQCTALHCRRLYDCLVSALDEKGEEFGDIRRVLERGMKNGAVSLMKDVSDAKKGQNDCATTSFVSWRVG